MKMMHRLLLMLCIWLPSFAVAAAEITPHKYTDAERQNGGPKYDIPSSSRFTTKRIGAPITYMRILDMDHYVRKREDVINDSFAWLKKQLEN